MAIIRCPYCHAITDENDKYCNNCGTQLLFPDDENVEEEIPGEKIIDAETEEKDYEIDEPGGASKGEDEEEPGEGAPGSVLLEEAEDEGQEDDKSLAALIEDEETEQGAAGEPDAEETGGKPEKHEEPEEVVLADEIAEHEASAKEEVEEETGSGGTAETGFIGLKEEADAGSREIPDTGSSMLESREPTQPPAGGEDAEPAERATIASSETDEETREIPIPPSMRGEGTDKETETTAAVEAEPAAGPTPEAPKSVTFDTSELEGIGRTVDLSKARLDKFIDGIAGKVPPPAKPAEAPMPKENTGSLPPWANRMKGEPTALGRDAEAEGASPFEEAKRSLMNEDTPAGGSGAAESAAGRPDTRQEEEEIFPHRKKKSDSGLGYPERLTQAVLPFEAKEAGGGEEEIEEAVDEEAEEALAAGEAEEAEEDFGPLRQAPVMPPATMPTRTGPAKPRAWEPPTREEEAVIGAAGEEGFEEEAAGPPFNFSVFAKSKAFDIFFLAFFWLIAVWIAAHSMGSSLFKLLGTSGGPLFLFYLILVLLYFFLFKFFLGETLGDRLFRERPGSRSDSGPGTD